MNVKKGDLAIVIKSACGNEGQIIEVMKFLGTNPIFQKRQWFKGGYGLTWLIKFQNPVRNTRGVLYIECPCPDAWLRPVSGLPEVDTIDTEHPVEESA